MDWQAEWIWHPTRDEMDNFYLHARKPLVLGEVPDEAKVFVTASSLYKLYINGQPVGRGPNPADPSRYYFDTYEVSEHLQAGENVVAALCYNYGPESRGILRQNWGRGGFLLELRADGETLLATDGSWKVLQAPAWDQDAPVNCTLYGDFKEIYDSRREPEGWLEPPFDDSEWQEPDVLGKPPVEPWTRLIPAEIPPLGGERVRPLNSFWESASVTYSWRDDWEVYNEGRLAGDAPQAAEEDTRVMKTHADFNPSVILDFGRDVTGYVEIEIADSAGGVMDVLYGEDLYLTRVDTFVLKGGRQVLRPFNRRTFRYCKLLFRKTPDWVHIEDVSVEMSTYPVEHRGEFRCSDDLLNRIWDVGRYSMRLSMLDHFVDCPWRERTLYGGDMYAENLIAHYAFGDPRMNRKCLRQMAHIQYPEGPLPPWGPYRGCGRFYPPWSAFWGLALLDHYELTAEKDLLEELWPNLRRLLEWTIEQSDNEVGLIGSPSAGWFKQRRREDPFRAWMEAEKTQYLVWHNAPFAPLLRRAAAAARVLGREKEAERYRAAGEDFAAAMHDALLDEETGRCGDYDLQTGRTDGGQSRSGMVLWSGALDAGPATKAVEALFDRERSGIGAPFHGLLLVEGLYRYGRSQEALDFMRRYWGEMLRRGATTFWDNFSLDWRDGKVAGRNTSLCHGWAAGPTYSLGAHVLGVRPQAAGFAEIRIEPEPGDLEWAAGAVPTPQGDIEVRWTRAADVFRIEASIPEGCTASVALPPLPTRAHTVKVDGVRTEARVQGPKLVVQVPAGNHEIVRQVG